MSNRNIKAIYLRYRIPKNLQEHMLRVAGLSLMITDFWKGSKIDKKSITEACALHDIAKPMAFDLTKAAQYGTTAKEVDEIKALQKEMKDKYGEEEHKAAVKIAEEIVCSKNTLRLLDNLEWTYIPRLLEENDIESLIPIYCDMRIGPNGILSIKKRVKDLEIRREESFSKSITEGEKVEKLIQKNIEIDLNKIKDEKINKESARLLEF